MARIQSTPTFVERPIVLHWKTLFNQRLCQRPMAKLYLIVTILWTQNVLIRPWIRLCQKALKLNRLTDGADTVAKFRKNKIDTIANYDLAPCITKCSAAIILTILNGDGIVNLNTLHHSFDEFTTIFEKMQLWFRRPQIQCQFSRRCSW